MISGSKRKHRIASYDKRHKLIGVLFALPAIVFLLAFFVYPVLYNIWLSFTNASLNIKKETSWVWFDNYIKLCKNKLFGQYVWNTVVWTFWSVLGQLGLGLAIALLISRPMKGMSAVRNFLLIPYVVPAITIALVSRWMLNSDYGIISHWLQQAGWLEKGQSLLALKGPAMAVVIILNIWLSYPFPMLIYWAAIKNIPGELYEAVKVDGATTWQGFLYITFPELNTTTITLLILRIVWTATYYDLIKMVTSGGPVGSTMTLPILIYETSFGKQQIGSAKAISMVLGIVMFICVILYVTKSGVLEE